MRKKVKHTTHHPLCVIAHAPGSPYNHQVYVEEQQQNWTNVKTLRRFHPSNTNTGYICIYHKQLHSLYTTGATEIEFSSWVVHLVTQLPLFIDNDAIHPLYGVYFEPYAP